ncbi:hypothetical protein STEG23_015835 [Scotinomys teguina]
MEVLPAGGTRDPLRAEEEAAAAGHLAGEGEEEPQPPGRTSRTASLVSGLLTELYSCTEEEEVAAGGNRASRGRPGRSDSLDSSTETSGSDVFLGGRGVGDSRVLQELRERPSLRLQMQYLRRKDSSELKTILRELKYRIGIQSPLLRQLKQKDRLLHKVQKNMSIACLQAVSQKRRSSAGTQSIDSLLEVPSLKTDSPSLQPPMASGSSVSRTPTAACSPLAREPRRLGLSEPLRAESFRRSSEDLGGRRRSRMRQDKLTGSLRRGGRCLKRQGGGGVGTILSNVLKKRSCISRTAPRLLCTLEPGVDTKLKFTLEPSLGQNGFQQWYDALKAVARLSTGIPKEWRRKVWLTLADHYLHSIAIDWAKTMRFTFNERSNPDDDSMGIQIVKLFCLEVFVNNQKLFPFFFLILVYDGVSIMIYLIDKVLPESYFVNNLRALSVDMAVFRDLLRMKLPELSQHLDALQRTANKESGGGYEPPLTNVFTMQWFLTLFATCLPNHTVLKIWDSVFFEGSEIILRVSLAIWAKLGEQIECCETADEFYSTMGRLTQEMLENDLLQSHELMQTVYSMAPFPFPQLAELREKYTYNITPFPATIKPTSVPGRHGKARDSDEENDLDDEDAIARAVGCLGPFSGLLAPELQKYQKQIKEVSEEQRLGSNNIAELSPGAINSCRSEYHAAFNSMMMERMTTDINALKRQYSRIKKKQQQQVHQVYIRAGKKMMVANRTTKNAVIHIPGHAGGKISPVPYEDLKTKLNSPWRTHIRVHKKNMPRTKSHLGCGDTVGLIEEQSEVCRASSLGAAEEFPSACAATAHGEGSGCDGGTPRTIEGQSPEPVFGDADVVDVAAVQVKLEALELNQRDAPAETEPKAHLPCQRHASESASAPAENQATSKPLPGSNSKTTIFSPFPSVKPLRKSATARNLGLYGPTERTPTMHFPQISRSFSKSGIGSSNTKKR